MLVRPCAALFRDSGKKGVSPVFCFPSVLHRLPSMRLVDANGERARFHTHVSVRLLW
jgi:hypothetical protein